MKPIRSVMLWIPRMLLRAAGIALFIIILCLLILFGLQFVPSPGLKSLWSVVQIHRLLDPYLRWAGSWAGVPWPPARSWSFLPLAAAVALWGLKSILDAAARGLRRAGRKAVRSEAWKVEKDTRAGKSAGPGSVPASPPSSQSPANPDVKRIGRYEVIGDLGRGAMGAVYKARDPQINRTVAIKMIAMEDLKPEEINQYKQRFHREAQTAGQLSHPGIVMIHDAGEDGLGHPYLVMEYVEGTTLDDYLEPPAPDGPSLRRHFGELLEIAVQVAEAMDYAHRSGVIHRDIKPANILVTREGRAKIADFGVAKKAGTQTTRTGELVGTPAFMSPEQVAGGPVDSRSDIFSLGILLYWMFTGSRAFPGQSIAEVAYKVMHTTPPSIRERNPRLPRALETVVERCLAKEPAARYQTAREVMQDLAALRGSVRE